MRLGRLIGKNYMRSPTIAKRASHSTLSPTSSTFDYIMPRRLRVSILSLLLFVTTLSTAQNIQYATRFPKNKLYDLSPSSTGLDNIDGTVAAFGDFNGDK